MSWIVPNLWLIPALPLLAAGLSALAKQRHRKFASALAIGSMVGALALSCVAFVHTLQHSGEGAAARRFVNFGWLQFGDSWLKLGWVLDPLGAVMLVMVSLVGLLIFIYSLGYMAHDENFTRFFCFLSLFAAAMLGVVIANSLLLLFICWELVGLTSYLLIGFWYQKPSAAAAAKKAFITTRIGDLAFLLGMVWLYSQTGTLLFYDDDHTGCIEGAALIKLIAQTTSAGMAVSTGISLLIFCGAVGKSGQVPLHVWLPDAMEGPTPVSALIHAATMVAAGVFLVARVYPLMEATLPTDAPYPATHALAAAMGHPNAPKELLNDPEVLKLRASSRIKLLTKGSKPSAALKVVTWVGVITAIFAASIAVAQTDIKRILAYSTVSQLGFMMMGLGVGGVAVGMFHLITHAFFKALLFMGAGSVIHGCHEEQDIRRMGGLLRFMPLTFATYAVGMLALSGFPLLFSGFWSKDEILHSAERWSVSHWPFYLGLFGALLTAFYMSRQVCYVFFGALRSSRGEEARPEIPNPKSQIPKESEPPHVGSYTPHESPQVMTIPLIILAAGSILLGFIGTPAWPWFQDFLMGGRAVLLKRKYFVDEIYEGSLVRFNAWWARACGWLDDWIWNGAVQLLAYAVVGLSWVDRFFDEYVVNLGFDESCRRLTQGGSFMSRLQDGRVQNYLRVIGIALTVLVLFLIWGCRAS